MKKYLVLALTFAGATGVSLGLRHALHGPATASSRHEEARPDALSAPAQRPTNLDGAGGPEGEGATSLRFAAARAPAEPDPAELLLARIAHDAGSYLLARAANAPGNTRLPQQAAQHLRACLSHEGHAGGGTLFVEARRKLAAAERLLAEANRPAVRPEETRARVPGPPKPAPVVAAPRPAPAPTPKSAALEMVGPDGVLFERAGE